MIRAQIAGTRQRRRTTEAEFRRVTLSNLQAAAREAEATRNEYVKALARDRHRRLYAPVAGVVQELAVHTVGGVVTPAQPLMRIVPRGDRMEAEAWLPNRDVGFVRAGDTAEVKVETFPFTRYGTLPAEIVAISSDAVPKEQLGLVYAVRARLTRSSMQVDGRVVNVTPGMAVSVEIKTGKRRLIEYFLSPLLRGLRESLHER